MLRTLRQPRYVALGALMLIVALVCVAAGTWQVYRFEGKRHENDRLRTNAYRDAAPVGRVLPTVGAGKSPSSDDVEFRTVTARGHYQASGQSLVRAREVDDTNGYLVLTPFRTADATLLVVRGFVGVTTADTAPVPAAPPGGTVTIRARAQAPESRNDLVGQLPTGEVQSVNPRLQEQRLGGSMYNGYADLESGQPGTRGLTAIPKPDLSNPAGGALEPQHFAYVIQWYLFAILALAAPFAMARAERKHHVEREFDLDVPTSPATVEPVEAEPAQVRAAKLADRYGRAPH